MGTVALQNMLFAGGLNEMDLGSNFAVGKSAGPKAKLAGSDDATTPDNTCVCEAQGPVESGNDFKYELASKVKSDRGGADKTPVNQSDASGSEPEAEKIEAVGQAVQTSEVALGSQAQAQLAAGEGFRQPQQNNTAQMSNFAEGQLIATEGKVSDSVSKALQELSANGQANATASEETIKVLDTETVVVDNRNQMPTETTPDSIVVEVKTSSQTQPDTEGANATGQQQQPAQDAGVALKTGDQASAEPAIKDDSEQNVGKAIENAQSDSKNMGQSVQGQIKNNSADVSDSELDNQQADSDTGSKEGIKTSLQQGFSNNLNVQINNQTSANENVTEQAVPLNDSAATEPKIQTVEAEQNNTNTLLNNIAERAGEQIQSTISDSVGKGQNEVTVQLSPPELGRVVIKLQQEQGQITGLLEFSKTQTKLEVENLLPQLVRGLQDAGISVRKLDVVQTQVDNSSYEQFKEYVGQDSNGQQQQDVGSNQSQTEAFAYEWSAESTGYQTMDWSEQPVVSDEAVNILV